MGKGVMHDYVGSTDTASIAPNWTTTPTGTIIYAIYRSAPSNTSSPPAVNVTQVNGTAQTAGDIPAQTAAILLDTAEIGTAGAGLTAVPWNAAWDAEVESEATDALNAYDPPTKAELDVLGTAALATAAALATVDANVDTLVSPYITGTTSGTPSTTSSDTDLTGYADDELIGRTIVFTGGTANGQAGRITDYANTSGVVTYTTLATAPAASDPFVIV